MYTPIIIANSDPLVGQTDETLRSYELSKYSVVYDVTEESFDQLAKMATQLLDFPIGGISLVDSKHVWLKARIGVELTCLERDGSFCACAVDSNLDFFTVEDTLNDPRFNRNPLVTDLGVRFYAAAPLFNKGYCLGTLWLMDTKPRSLSHNDKVLMQGLSLQTSRLLDYRYRNELTGFPNLAMFKKKMQAILNRICDQSSALSSTEVVSDAEILPLGNKNIAFGFLKIHEIYRVNNVYGREATDLLIKNFSDTFRFWLGNDNYYAQADFNKFTFAIAFPSISDLTEKLEGLQEILSNLFPIEDTQTRILATVGVSLFPSQGNNVTSLLDQAENSVRYVKNPTDSSVRICTLSDSEESQLLTDLIYDIRQFQDNHNIDVSFQPQINFLTAELIGFEALACWKHSQFGLIPAQRFLPLAKDNNLIHKIDIRVFLMACQALRSWLDDGIDVKSISCNFSQSSLTYPGTIQLLDKILIDYAIPKDKIEIEITESALFEKPEKLQLITKQLHVMGLKISIDVFGTGLSDVFSFRSLKFDRIKIDRRIIKSISVNPDIAGVFHFIKGISEAYGVELLCDGLENTEDLDVLERAHVGCVQGRLFSDALTMEKIPHVVEQFEIVETDRKRYTENYLRIAELFKFNDEAVEMA